MYPRRVINLLQRFIVLQSEQNPSLKISQIIILDNYVTIFRFELAIIRLCWISVVLTYCNIKYILYITSVGFYFFYHVFRILAKNKAILLLVSPVYCLLIVTCTIGTFRTLHTQILDRWLFQNRIAFFTVHKWCTYKMSSPLFSCNHVDLHWKFRKIAP